MVEGMVEVFVYHLVYYSLKSGLQQVIHPSPFAQQDNFISLDINTFRDLKTEWKHVEFDQQLFCWVYIYVYVLFTIKMLLFHHIDLYHS